MNFSAFKITFSSHPLIHSLIENQLHRFHSFNFCTNTHFLTPSDFNITSIVTQVKSRFAMHFIHPIGALLCAFAASTYASPHPNAAKSVGTSSKHLVGTDIIEIHPDSSALEKRGCPYAVDCEGCAPGNYYCFDGCEVSKIPSFQL